MSLRSFSNCVLYAVAQYFRHAAIERRLLKLDPSRPRRRAYLMVRRSDWGSFPHVLYARTYANGRIRLVSYKPASPIKRTFPPPLFKGVLRWGDSLPQSSGGSVDDSTKP